MLPTDAKSRKDIPIYSGFIKYFPKAIAAVAELSRKGNDQHNPGKPLHWDRSKSGDELDAQMRHITDMAEQGEGATDTDEVLHATKNAWRAMAGLEKLLEKQQAEARTRGRDAEPAATRGHSIPAAEREPMTEEEEALEATEHYPGVNPARATRWLCRSMDGRRWTTGCAYTPKQLDAFLYGSGTVPVSRVE